MLVQYHERFDLVAEFDPESGVIKLLPRPRDLPPSGTDGWFSILSGICVVFYRRSNRLWLRVAEQTFDLDGGASVDWRLDGQIASFVVEDTGVELVLTYRSGPNSGPPLSDDPTPFIEDEQWDLGLFVANIMFDEERRELVRQSSTSHA